MPMSIIQHKDSTDGVDSCAFFISPPVNIILNNEDVKTKDNISCSGLNSAVKPPLC
jgi:hypothetical protein